MGDLWRFHGGSSFIYDYHSEYLDVSTGCLNDLVFAISAVLRRLFARRRRENAKTGRI